MVVGFESVGKTILDCLFPLEGVLIKRGKVSSNKERFFRLQGSVLSRHTDRTNSSPVDRSLSSKIATGKPCLWARGT